MWFSTRWLVETIQSLALVSLVALGQGQALANPLLPNSRLQGEATLKYFGLRVYHARLWTLPGFSPTVTGDQPLLLELEYLRDFQGQAIAERSLKEIQRTKTLSNRQAQDWLSAMQRVFPDVKTGDRITGRHQPGQAAQFWHNGKPIGQIDDLDFAQAFFDIWLAPTSSQPQLRLALLGQDDSRTNQ